MRPTVTAVLALVALPALAEATGDVEYGEYLAQECASCHQSDVANDGIPSITGWAEEQFVAALAEYREGTRTHPVMQTITARLGDAELAALAAYFATLPAAPQH